jgi:hypothetical protein
MAKVAINGIGRRDECKKVKWRRHKGEDTEDLRPCVDKLCAVQ